MGLGEVCVCVPDLQTDFHKLVKEKKKTGCLSLWIAKLSMLQSGSSILPSSCKKKNGFATALHPKINQLPFSQSVTKLGSNCCQQPLKAPEEKGSEIQEVAVSLATAKENNMDAFILN